MLSPENLTHDELAEELQKALIQGPPAELCGVMEKGTHRHFTKEEHAAMGSRLFLSDRVGPKEIPMDIPGHPGWNLVLED